MTDPALTAAECADRMDEYVGHAEELGISHLLPIYKSAAHHLCALSAEVERLRGNLAAARALAATEETT